RNVGMSGMLRGWKKNKVHTKLIDAEIRELTSPPTPPPDSDSHSDTQSQSQSQPTNSPRLSTASTVVPSTPTVPSSSAEHTAAAAAASAAVTRSEPDLLMVFGPLLRLDGYPPWQLRLTEIYCTGDKGGLITGGGEAVEYQKFLKGLWRFAKAEMRFGR
ncbi:hypothetical protein FQN53_008386, partial [Emmonsiellopsis sp. PD_33]